ncbi:hypothetical protein KZZ07_27385, partial [Mameliella sp. CS4]|uniref:hypothetical protein n=1 Tax=Mameliella sp. CS4 TaxID=2862329 RepID=UPI001C5E800A
RTKWELRPSPLSEKKRTNNVAFDLKRDLPPAEPVVVVEEWPEKKKKRQFITTKSSEATESNKPSESTKEDIDINQLKQ